MNARRSQKSCRGFRLDPISALLRRPLPLSAQPVSAELPTPSLSLLEPFRARAKLSYPACHWASAASSPTPLSPMEPDSRAASPSSTSSVSSPLLPLPALSLPLYTPPAACLRPSPLAPSPPPRGPSHPPPALPLSLPTLSGIPSLLPDDRSSQNIRSLLQLHIC